MPASKNSFIDHVKWFRNAVRTAGGEAIVAMDSWQAFVRKDDRQYVFFPQFQASIDGQLQYQNMLTDDAFMFAGWLPYRGKRWDIAVDKLAFKRYAGVNGLPVPPSWTEDNVVQSGVVVKRARSSFGEQVQGPYRSSSEHPLDVALGEYYEQFVEGSLLKVWFWQDTPVCAELDRLPTVLGDGVSSMADLIIRRASQHKRPTGIEKQRLLQRCEVVLRYFGHELNETPGKGVSRVVEFRYGSTLMHPGDRRVVDLTAEPAESWVQELRLMGRKLNAAIPLPIRPNTLFTVDAILTAQGKPLLLEVNCNPTVHPLAYPHMARSLISSPSLEYTGAPA